MLRSLIAVLLLMVPSCAPAAPPCVPKLYGQATSDWPFYLDNANGQAVYWYCDDGLHIRDWYVVCEAGACLSNAAAYVHRALRSLNPVAGFQAEVWDRLPKIDCLKPTPVLAAICGNTVDAIRANVPAQPKYTVETATAADGTRPAFAFADGARKTTSNGRATAGAPCDQVKAATEFKVTTAGKRTVYASVNGRSDQVALCRRLP